MTNLTQGASERVNLAEALHDHSQPGQGAASNEPITAFIRMPAIVH